MSKFLCYAHYLTYSWLKLTCLTTLSVQEW